MKKPLIIQTTELWFSNMMIGGSWGIHLSPQVQQNLRWFWLDGLFASASDNVYLNFISLYVLALGATQLQIGLMSSLSNLAGAALLILGAFLAERIPSHKWINLLSGGGAGRLALLMLVFVPIFFEGQKLIWIAIALSVARDSLGNLSYPAWVSIISDIVPIEGRGRYFGSRNLIMGITTMVATLLAGKLITLFVAFKGYQIALGLAFVLGAFSTLCFAQIKETLHPVNHSVSLDLRRFFHEIRNQPMFVALLVTTAIWNVAVNISGPFFNVFMVQDLNFNASDIGILAVLTSLAGLFVQNRVGILSDKWGPLRVQLISMITIPFLPIAWIFVSQFWHVVLIIIGSGILWAAFNLASFNLMLEIIPDDRVPRYSAIYQIIVTLSLALGALIGSGIVTNWGYHAVFLSSGIVRWISCGLFLILLYRPARINLVK